MRHIGIVILAGALLVSCGAAEKAADLTDATATPFAAKSATAVTSPTATGPGATPTVAATVTPSPVPGKVTVKESGFAAYKDSLGNVNVPWAAILENGSTTQQAANTKVTAIFYDASNVVLKTDDSSVPVIFPGQVSAAGDTFLQMSAVPTRLEVRLAGTTFQAGQTTSGLTISEVTVKTSTFDSKVSGKVSSPFNKDIKNLKLICVVTAADGTYLAVGTSYLALLPAGATAIAECSIDSRLKVTGAASTRLFASFSSITDIAQ